LRWDGWNSSPAAPIAPPSLYESDPARVISAVSVRRRALRPSALAGSNHYCVRATSRLDWPYVQVGGRVHCDRNIFVIVALWVAATSSGFAKSKKRLALSSSRV
jgi:hypothetical protein